MKNYQCARNSATSLFKDYGDEQSMNFYREVGLEIPPVAPSTTATTTGTATGRSSPSSVGAPMEMSLHKRRRVSIIDDVPPVPAQRRVPREVTVDQPSLRISNETLNPRAQYQLSCGSCEMCRRPECHNCVSCYKNKGQSSRFPEVCFRKMCSMIPVDRKKVPAAGFPPGWSFFFQPSRDIPLSNERDRRIPGLVIVSPTGQRLFSIQEAASLARGEGGRGTAASILATQKRQREFYDQIGESTFLPFTGRHPLLGEPYTQEWIRADGTKMLVSGKVVVVERDILNNDEQFTISYNAESLALVHSRSPAGLKVKPSSQVDNSTAWDGVLRSHETIVRPNSRLLTTLKPPGLERWLTPLAVSREMVPNTGAPQRGYRELPILRLRFRGFLLKFRVAKSTIEGAGFGVFLSVFKELDQGPNDLRLESGELLDFGVYAPYRAEDIRCDHEFLLKSLIHDCKNEVYAFDGHSREIYLDITDNWTGELHMLARTHVHPFVNEIQDPVSEIPNVLARRDPEGALHYLIGHTPQDSAEPFVVAADGSEQEIFVDYEETYENVVSTLLTPSN